MVGPNVVPESSCSLQLCGNLQVRAWPRVGIPAQLHRGNDEQGMSMYADARTPRYANVAVDPPVGRCA